MLLAGSLVLTALAADPGSTTVSLTVHRVTVLCSAGGTVAVDGVAAVGKGVYYTAGSLTLEVLPETGWRRGDTLTLTGDAALTVDDDGITLSHIASDVTLRVGFETDDDGGGAPSAAGLDDPEAPGMGDAPGDGGGTASGDGDTGPTSPFGSPEGEAQARAVLEESPVVDGTVTLTEDQVDRLRALDPEGRDLILPLAALSEEITGVALPADSLRELAEDGGGIRLLPAGGGVELANGAVRSVADQAAGAVVLLRLEPISVAELTEAQRTALKRTRVALCLCTAITCDGVDISDSWTGSVTIRVPFTPETGVDISEYSVVQVAEDGTVDLVEAEYSNGAFAFVVHQFSDFIVVRDPGSGQPYEGLLALLCLILLFLLTLLGRIFQKRRAQWTGTAH